MTTSLPLEYVTPSSWAEGVLLAPAELLSDHAWLEKKAANNALDLLHQCPSDDLASHWTTVLTAVARDEVQHLGLVCRQLNRLGGRLSKGHGNAYATDLHRLVRRGQGPLGMVDRLLVAALIEARSCERFGLLAAASADGDLRRLYERLTRSEAGHYQVFLRLAEAVHRTWAARWAELLSAESAIIQQQPAGPSMHSGLVQRTGGGEGGADGADGDAAHVLGQ